MTAKRILVLGTGTDVGKTAVSAALLRSLSGTARWAGLKPVETGYVERASDAATLARAAGHALVTPWFTGPDPVSPHLAARAASRELTEGVLARWVEEQSQRLGVDSVLIETAGGAFSPLGPETRMWHLVRALGATDVVLVTSNRLGALHDTLCAKAALDAAGVKLRAVVLNEVSPDGSSAANLVELPSLLGGMAVVRHTRGQPQAPELAALLSLASGQ